MTVDGRVVFFDYWTKGIDCFLPVYERLSRDGYDCLLVHLGSWRDPGVPREEVIEGLTCRDIRFYDGSIRRALIAEEPDVVLALNTTYTVDRIVNRLCRGLGIRTIYMMHGIRAVGDYLREAIRRTNRHWTGRRRLARVPKYAGISWAYLEAVARTEPLELLSPLTYAHFVQLCLSPGRYLQRPWPHKDIYSDRALVYANVYRDLMVHDVGYPSDRVVVVGNPNLDAAFALLRDRERDGWAQALLRELGVPDGRDAVAYMEDAFVEMGLWTEAARQEELSQVATAVKEVEMDLVVKMHPSTHAEPMQAAFKADPHVHVVLKTDLARLVYGCRATVGHYSTTLMLPVVFDRPLIIPGWSKGIEKFDFYVSTGAGMPVATPSELTQVLTNLEGAFADFATGRQSFIERYVTLTDGAAWERIVAEIKSLALAAGRVR